jgi:hypothetical protein
MSKLLNEKQTPRIEFLGMSDIDLAESLEDAVNRYGLGIEEKREVFSIASYLKSLGKTNLDILKIFKKEKTLDESEEREYLANKSQEEQNLELAIPSPEQATSKPKSKVGLFRKEYFAEGLAKAFNATVAIAIPVLAAFVVTSPAARDLKNSFGPEQFTQLSSQEFTVAIIGTGVSKSNQIENPIEIKKLMTEAVEKGTQVDKKIRTVLGESYVDVIKEFDSAYSKYQIALMVKNEEARVSARFKDPFAMIDEQKPISKIQFAKEKYSGHQFLGIRNYLDSGLAKKL